MTNVAKPTVRRGRYLGLIASLLLWGCQHLVFGVPLDVWERMSEAEHLAAIEAYMVQQNANARADRLEEQCRRAGIYGYYGVCDDLFRYPYYSYRPYYRKHYEREPSSSRPKTSKPSGVSPPIEIPQDTARGRGHEDRPVAKGKGRERNDDDDERKGQK
jgi:hypothetical protein